MLIQSKKPHRMQAPMHAFFMRHTTMPGVVFDPHPEQLYEPDVCLPASLIYYYNIWTQILCLCVDMQD